MIRKYLLIIILWLPFLNLDARQLHTVLVIDSQASNIQEAAKEDYRNMSEILREIASLLKVDYNEVKIFGDELTRENVFLAIDSIDVQPDDIVIFYFTGHGFRTSQKSDQWPYFFFEKNRQYMDFMEVSVMLMDKNPHFLMVLADCCNELLFWPVMPMYSAEKVSKEDKRKELNYSTLFLESPTCILVSSSSPGERSWCYSIGGIFTNSLIHFLEANAKGKKTPSWEKILEQVKDSVYDHVKENIKTEQTAQYLIQRR